MAHRLQDAVQTLDLGEIVGRAVAVLQLVHEVCAEARCRHGRACRSRSSRGKEMDEIARHLEHVAAVVEHHEGAGGRYVLEGDAPVEFGSAQADTGRAAHLHRLGVLGATVLKHLAYAHAERVLVQPGCAQSPETLRILVPADAFVPIPAYQRRRDARPGTTRQRFRRCSPRSAG